MKPLKLIPAKDAGTIDQVFDIDCVADIDTRQLFIDGALSRNLPRVVNRPRRPGKVAIVGSGPSVTDCVEILQNFDGEIWGINRSLEWMRHRGIKPTGFVGLDPEWFLVESLPNPTHDLTYYLAAQVHPQVFDHLKDHNVKLWFMADGQVKQPADACLIYGGSTCLGRAPNLAYALGYRDVHIFGGDSSYTHKTHVHGGELPENWVPVELNGTVYKTNRMMLSQACEFSDQMVEWAKGKDPMEVTLYGDGLMQALFAHQMQIGSYQNYLREEFVAGAGMNRKQRRAMRKTAA